MRAQDLLVGLRGRDRRMGLTLVAYAAGDAFGVPYEFLESPRAVDPLHLGHVDDWPAGGVSDDTALTLLTLEALTPDDAQDSARQFLLALHREAPRLRGLGPTTKHALGLEVKASERHLIGRSNGALMRTSLCGLAFLTDSRRRDDAVGALARATHAADEAVGAALVGAALFSYAMDSSTRGAPLIDLAGDAARDAASGARHLIPWADGLVDWQPPAQGVSLDPLETLAAVLWVARNASGPLDAFIAACELGGDTDTVAALSGALVTAHSHAPEEVLDVPWLDEVAWSEVAQVPSIVHHISNVRNAQ